MSLPFSAPKLDPTFREPPSAKPPIPWFKFPIPICVDLLLKSLSPDVSLLQNRTPFKYLDHESPNMPYNEWMEHKQVVGG